MRMFNVKVRTSHGTVGPFRVHARDIGHARRLVGIEWNLARPGHGAALEIHIWEGQTQPKTFERHRAMQGAK